MNNGATDFSVAELATAYEKAGGNPQAVHDVALVIMEEGHDALYPALRHFYTWAYICSRKADWFDRNTDSIEERITALVQENQHQKELLKQAEVLLEGQIPELQARLSRPYRHTYFTLPMLALYTVVLVFISMAFLPDWPGQLLIALAGGFMSSMAIIGMPEWFHSLWAEKDQPK